MRPASLYAILSILFVIVLNTIPIRGAVIWSQPCKPNKFNENKFENCEWGETYDICDRLVCAKGPGEQCGGPHDRWGSCADGLMCKSYDNKCHGCALKLIHSTRRCYQE